MTRPWRFELLGVLRVRQGDVTIARFQTKRTGILLAYLAFVGEPMPREKVAEVVWPDGTSSAVRNRLNQAVSSLRRQLEDAGGEGQRVFESDHHSLGLTPGTFTTDLAEFREALDAAAATDEPATRALALATAVGLWRGPLLEGYSEPWIESARPTLVGLYRRALTELVELQRAAGRVGPAIQTVNRLLALDPGDPLARQWLDDLLTDVGPSPSISDLADAPFEPDPRVEEAAPRAFVGSTLPTPSGPLFGREAELREAESEVRSGPGRALLLTGLGGIGKTRLAVELARLLVGKVFDEALFVPVTIDGQERRPLWTLLETLLPGVDAGRRSVAAAADFLARLRRPLVIVDSVRASDAELLDAVRTLRAAVPDLCVVLTSREPLPFDATLAMLLGPLERPRRGESDLAAVAANPSVRVFCQRARRIRPDFAVTERVASPVAEVCRIVDGVPLALELAATWVRTMTPAQIHDRARSLLGLLETSRRDVPPSHRSMRRILAETFDGLSDAARAALPVVASFPAGWSFAALEAVQPGCDAPRVCAELVDAGLAVCCDRGAPSIRFELLGVARAFAAEVGSQDGLSIVRRRLTDFFIGHLGQLRTQGEHLLSDEVCRQVQADYGNLLHCLGWCLQRGDAVSAAHLCCALVPYWIQSRRLPEGRLQCEAVLEIADLDQPATRLLLAKLSRLLWLQGDRAAAREMARQASDLAKSHGDDQVLLEALMEIQGERHAANDHGRSAELLEEIEAMATKLGDQGVLARVALRRGNRAVELGDEDGAERHYRKCMEIGRAMGHEYAVVGALCNLGNLARRQGRLDLARLTISEAVALSRKHGFGLTEIVSLTILARVCAQAGEIPEALSTVLLAARLSDKANAWMTEVIDAIAHVGSAAALDALAAQAIGFCAVAIGPPPTQDGIYGREREELRARLVGEYGERWIADRMAFGSLRSFRDLVETLEQQVEPLTAQARVEAKV